MAPNIKTGLSAADSRRPRQRLNTACSAGLAWAAFCALLVTGLAATFDTASGQMVLEPDRVFDGERMYAGWAVRVEGDRITAAGADIDRSGARVVPLPGMTLLPGLIDAHSHVLLHPYSETSWNDQVLRESRSVRVARATVHARRTLEAGFTTLRDLGSEGADYADVGVRDAIRQGIIPGPRILVAGKALVATGSYGPKGFHPDFDVPLGAEEADGIEGVTRVARDQIGHGIDVVKVYADYRWGPRGEARPTFSVEELRAIVAAARSSGRLVVAHAATAEGMRRATEAGVVSIEHGDGATDEVLRLMADRGVALCPTLGAVESIMAYNGWRKGVDPEPDRVGVKKDTFRRAMEAGVTMCLGSDVGVFPHGENAMELELMVEYGLTPRDALRAATSVNAEILGMGEEIGRILPGWTADLIAVRGDPSVDITAARAVAYVMQAGREVVVRD